MSNQDSQPSHFRRIRSYVLRGGRLTPGQEQAFRSLWPQWGIEFTGETLDLAKIFGNNHPLHLEIGFGNGETLAAMAQAHPEINYLGIEVHRPGVGHLLMKIEELGLSNLRVLCHDAVEILEKGVTDAALAAVYLFFPDPWHKKKHHKRRILSPVFLQQLERIIGNGGQFHAATDWEDYAQQMMEVLSTSKEFKNIAGAGNYTPRPDYRPVTKFERRGMRLGHGVWDLRFTHR